MTQIKQIPLVVFSHGNETGPWGTKIRRLADVAQAAGWQVLSVDYAALTGKVDAPVEHRLAALHALSLPVHSRLILVGSSMGGWVSAAAAMQLLPVGVFLLAPALGMPSYPSMWPAMPRGVDLEIIHGWDDDVIPYGSSVAYALQFKSQCVVRLHLLPDDHRLSATLNEVATLFEHMLRRSNGAQANLDIA